VLGHSGFLGQALLHQLAKERPELPAFGWSLGDLDLANPDATDRLAEKLTRHATLIVCAAVKRQLGDSPDAWRKNAEILATVAKLISEHPPARVIYLSSAAVYGEDVENTAITENTPYLARSYYGASKIAGEQLLKVACHTSKLISLRPPTIYGPGERTPSYGVGSFARDGIAQRRVVLWGDGSEWREMLFVEDVARLIVQLLEHPFSGALNVASGMTTSFREALDHVRAELPNEIEVIERARSKAKVDNAFDASLLRRVLPEFSFTTLGDGVRQTVAWYLQEHGSGGTR
jgi:UDP-glucose 4-epimerase